MAGAMHGGGEKTGARKRRLLRVRMSPARSVVRAGVLVAVESSLSSFRCRYPGGCGAGWPTVFYR